MSKTLQLLPVEPNTHLMLEAAADGGSVDLGTIDRAVERANPTTVDPVTGQRIALGFDDPRYVFTCHGVTFDDLSQRVGAALAGVVRWGQMKMPANVQLADGGRGVIAIVRRAEAQAAPGCCA